LLASANNVT